MSSDTQENGSPPKSEDASPSPVAPVASERAAEEAVPTAPQAVVEAAKIDQDRTATMDETTAAVRDDSPSASGDSGFQINQRLLPFCLGLAALLQAVLFYAFLPSARLFLAALIGAGIALLLYRVCFSGRAQAWRSAGVIGAATLAANLILGAAAPNLATQIAQHIAALGGSRSADTPFADTGRLATIIQRQVIAIDVEHGPPAADIRDFPAPGPVGYHATFANAQNDTLQVVLMAGDQIAARCKPYVMNGGGNYSCQFQDLDTGEYRFDVTINNVSVAKLDFGIGQTSNVRAKDAGPLREEEPKEEAAPAPPPVPAGPEQPPWRRKPSSRDLARLMPDRAADDGVSGRVVLGCTVIDGGRVACGVDEEEPRGYGFGAAAIRASRDFRMATEMPDGRSTRGMHVRIPIRFSP